MTKRLLLSLSVSLSLLVMAGCGPSRSDPEPDPADWTASLAFDRAAAGDLLSVLTPAGGAAATSVVLDGTQLTGAVPAADDMSLTVQLPGLPAGPVSVLLTHAQDSITAELTILAAADTAQLLLVVDPSLGLAQLNAILDRHGVPSASGLRPLFGPGSVGDCLGQLALIDVPEGHPSVGELLAELESEEEVWAADPKSEWGLSSVEPRRLNGSLALGQARPALSGSGITIAVLDTGVAAGIAELGVRRLEQIDVLTDGQSGDPYLDLNGNHVGHGTAVASLAAGASLGLAPSAEVLPVRVCDENGSCLASDVLLGVCSALSAVDPAEGLVLNLSLGGDSEVRVLSRVLESATERGAVVVAAAGNVAAAPPHWPAAASSTNPGLLAVGALQVSGLEADMQLLQAGVHQELLLAGVAQLRATGATANSYMRVPAAGAPAIELYGVEVEFELLGQADALRLVLQRATAMPPGLSLQLAGTDVPLDGLLDGGHMLSGDHLIQMYPAAATGSMELLIDPVPRQFTVSVPQALTITALELVQVLEAAGGYTSGDYLNLAAPAQELLASDPTGDPQALYTGTSFAAPQVAGAAALQLQRQLEIGGSVDAGEAAQAIIAGTIQVEVPAELAGAGRLDLRHLLGLPEAP